MKTQLTYKHVIAFWIIAIALMALILYASKSDEIEPLPHTAELRWEELK